MRKDQDLYGRHWNHNSPCLGDRTLEELGQVEWKRSFLKMTGLGNLSQLSVGEESEEITELDLTKLVSLEPLCISDSTTVFYLSRFPVPFFLFFLYFIDPLHLLSIP